MSSTFEQPAVGSTSHSGSRYFAAFFLVLSQIVCGIPLVVWPVVCIASAMTLGGHQTGNENPFLLGVVYTFCAASMAYPVPYFWGVKSSWRSFRRQEYRQAVLFGAVTPLYLGVVLALLWVWATTGS
jgi:hypothetical protein